MLHMCIADQLTSGLISSWIATGKSLAKKYALSDLKNQIIAIYYSTIMSFHQIRSRERAKYETVIHCNVPV